MKKGYYFLFLFIFSFSIGTNAQSLDFTNPDEDSFFLQLYQSNLEIFGEQFENIADFYQFRYDVEYYIKNKINLNTCKSEDLEKLRILSPLQISEIMEYRIKYGLFNSLMELQSVPSLNINTIRKLILFLKLNENNLSIKSKKDNDGVYQYRTSTLTGLQNGFRKYNKDSQSFLGYPFSQTLRIKQAIHRNLEFGILLNSQIGEPISFNYNKYTGVDYLTGFLKYKKNDKIQIILGNYLGRFGQGLNIWKGFALNRTTDINNASRSSFGLTPNLSSNQYSGFFGGALDVKINNHFKYFGFISESNLDARVVNFNDDTSYVQLFTSILSGGLHRTKEEIASKNTLKRLTLGSAVEYNMENFQLGYSAFVSKNNITQERNEINKYYISDSFLNQSIYQSIHFKNIRLFGEFAIDKDFDIATLQGINIAFSERIQAIGTYKYLSQHYYSPFASVFGANATSNNEKGWFFGIEYKPNKSLNFNLFAENSKNINYSLRLQDIKPSSQYYLEGIKVYKSKTELAIRLRYYNFFQNIPVGNSMDNFRFNAQNEKKSFRFQIKSILKRDYTLTFRTEYTFNNWINNSEGILSFFDFSSHHLFKKYDFGFRIIYFNISDYRSAIYSFESDVDYSYSVIPYFGAGQRAYLNFQYKLNDDLKIQSKVGITNLNSGRIGTGLTQINDAYRSDISLQLIWKLK